jgi:hypothetical protein
MHHEMIILNPLYRNDKAKILRSQFQWAIFDISMITTLDTNCVLFWECGYIESESDIRHSSKVLLLLGRAF